MGTCQSLYLCWGKSNLHSDAFQCFHAHDSIAPIDSLVDPINVCYGTRGAHGCRAGVLLFRNQHAQYGFRKFHIIDEWDFRSPDRVPDGFNLIGGVYGGGTINEPQDNMSAYEIEKFDHNYRLSYVQPLIDSFSFFGIMIVPQVNMIYCTYESSQSMTYLFRKALKDPEINAY